MILDHAEKYKNSSGIKWFLMAAVRSEIDTLKSNDNPMENQRLSMPTFPFDITLVVTTLLKGRCWAPPCYVNYPIG